MISLTCLLLSALLLAGPGEGVVLMQDATSLVRPEYRALASKLAIAPAYAPTSGNEFIILNTGRDFGEMLYKDFNDAGRLIEFELFLFGFDKDGVIVRDTLFSKVRQGVEVRYTHDSFGNFFDSIFDGRPVFKGFYDDMLRGGINLRDFTPWWNLHRTYSNAGRRQHRKIIIMDEKVAYTGGMNFTEGSLSGWGDCMLRITGPAVTDLRAIWAQNWNSMAKKKSDRVDLDIRLSEDAPTESGKILQVVPDGPDMPAYMAEEAIVWALENAKEYVWFQTPYFIPTSTVLRAMKKAAERGLDVRVIVPLVGDLPAIEPTIRSYFKTCVKSGVKIYQRYPPFDHSKTFLCDDYLVSIGTTNLDKLSLKRIYEVNTYIYDEETALSYKHLFLERQANSEPVTEELFDTWTSGEKFKQGLMRIVSPWL